MLADPQELLRLVARCKKHKNAGQPGVPGAQRAALAADQRHRACRPCLPSTLLPTLLPRSGVGAQRVAFGPRGPTMRQLSRIYDPTLVSLLVPGLVTSR